MYITFLLLVFLITESLYLLTVFILFPLLQPSPLVATNMISFLWVCLFLKYNCPLILCKFLLHNKVMQYFYMFQNDYYGKSSHHLSPSKIIHNFWPYSDTVHVITVTHLFLFYSWKLVSPNLPHQFLSSLTPLNCLLSGNHQFVLCTYDSVSVLLYLFICF